MTLIKTMRKNLRKSVPSFVKHHPGPLFLADDARVFDWVNAWARRNYSHLWTKYVEHTAETGSPKPINVAFPETMNEKMFWRKLFDFNPDFYTISDKIAAKDWVKAQGFDIAVPKTIWSGKSLDDLPKDLIGQDVILKANHAWKTVLWLSEPGLTLENIKERAGGWLALRHFEDPHEVSYERIDPLYFVEEGLGTRDLHAIELRIFTTGDRIGRVVAHQSQGEVKAAESFALDRFGQFVVCQSPPALTPDRLVIDLNAYRHIFEPTALKLGSMFDQMRTDFYIHQGRLYLGELTVYSLAGFIKVTGGDPMHPDARCWDIRKSWFMSTPQNGWRATYQKVLKRALDRKAEFAKTQPPVPCEPDHIPHTPYIFDLPDTTPTDYHPPIPT